MQSPYLTIDECALYLRLTKRTIYNKTHLKEIPFRKHGAKLIFHREELDAWSAAQAIAVKKIEKPLSKFQETRLRIQGAA